MAGKLEIAYDFIKQRIIDGIYRPGNRLIVDSIAKELNCSVIPVRESIRKLEMEGLVEHIPNVGASVTMIDEKAHVEILASIAVMEGYAYSISLPYIDNEIVNELNDYIREMEKAVYEEQDIIKYEELNSLFHIKVYEKCPNSHLVECMLGMRTKLAFTRKSVFSFIPKRAEESLRDHKEIVRLLQSGPPEEVERFVREHKFKSLQAFNQYISKR